MALFIFFPLSLFLPFYLLSLSLSLSAFFLFYFCFKLLYERLSFSPLNCNKDKGRKLPVRLRRKLYVGYVCNSLSKSCLLLLDTICVEPDC